jgi:ribonucleoside-diphosphate reductase alpha chain
MPILLALEMNETTRVRAAVDDGGADGAIDVRPRVIAVEDTTDRLERLVTANRAPACASCGSNTVPTGACYCCPNCGSGTGCS